MEPFDSVDNIPLEQDFEIHIPHQQPEQVQVNSGLPENGIKLFLTLLDKGLTIMLLKHKVLLLKPSINLIDKGSHAQVSGE